VLVLAQRCPRLWAQVPIDSTGIKAEGFQLSLGLQRNLAVLSRH
jgi:hypothetical protein